MPRFSASAKRMADIALKEAATDVLINAKRRAPFQKGTLRANSDVSMPGLLFRRISFWAEYARFQEFGGDDKRRVTKYTTSGTGAHFLKEAGDSVRLKLN